MALQVDGLVIEVDQEGYLIDPSDWSEAVARELARHERIELNDDHWTVIGFMREFYEQRQVAADARFVIKFLAEERGKGQRARIVIPTVSVWLRQAGVQDRGYAQTARLEYRLSA